MSTKQTNNATIIAIPHREPATIWLGGTYSEDELADLNAWFIADDFDAIDHWIDDKRHQWMRVAVIREVLGYGPPVMSEVQP